MSIEAIAPSMWDDIARVQSEVYHQIEPESLATLQAKWVNSPACCRVWREAGRVQAYLLAHRWHSKEPPKLHQPLPRETPGPYLFLHDLAVSPRLAGRGVGAQLVSDLLQGVRHLPWTCEQIRLVAIQGSVPFWQKQGFAVESRLSPGGSYGHDATLMRRVC